MLQFNPASRPTMADVLGHEWFRGETVTQAKFVEHCTSFMEKAKADRVAEQEATGIDYSIPASTGRQNRRGGATETEGYNFDTEFYMNHSFKPATQQKVGEQTT